MVLWASPSGYSGATLRAVLRTYFLKNKQSGSMSSDKLYANKEIYEGTSLALCRHDNIDRALLYRRFIWKDSDIASNSIM